MREIKDEISRIGVFFKKAAQTAVENKAPLITMMQSESNLNYVSDRIADLCEKEDLTEAEYLELTSAFFAYYVAGLASQQRG